MRSLRIAFFGTPEFAVPTLEELLAGGHAVVSVVTQPDRARGRGRVRSPSPVAIVAEMAGIPLLRPERVGDPEVIDALRAESPDLGVVVAFGQFLPKRVRVAPSLGYLINGHASLLPRFRGAAPIPRAILAGEIRSGVSIMRVEREMDAGPVALRRELEIGEDETAGDLSTRISALTAEAIATVVDQIAVGRASWTPQDHAAACSAPKIERCDATLDWRESAVHLVRQVRAMAPTPGATTHLDGEILRILAARAEGGATGEAPGRVRHPTGEPLRIATGDGWLRPIRVQRAGGVPMEIEAYLRGRDIPDGATLA